ncbi:AzlD domain-containing protein [Alkaliphilus peptidifermentans]|uniref:Branched-chain amino acid transport protein n=1 Tax=Alkaliphilus peptidifermentans DSM 18978 TaxID=1120976 RepID=A0A1G5LD76_9FIRM|nr:AzlD domain-containing protein [Alkaliphilus peptidifermentans]SCZ10099.1 Branched-chain amino acid transport protein [Alkaliphilus peptidifermentans DSM 18978]
MNNVLILIFGMALVTYIPRLLPFLIVSKSKLPDGLRQFLTFIPYTALGALIIPGVFNSIPELPLAAIMAILFATIYAWKKGGIIVPVLGSIGVAFAVLYLNNFLGL